MVELTGVEWALLAVAAGFVGLSKAALPGSNTVSIAIFAAILPAKQSTGALLVLLIVGDLFALLAYRRHADWPTLRRLVPTVVGGLLLGVLFLALADDTWVRRVIGVILLLVIGVTLLRRWAAARAQRRDPTVDVAQSDSGRRWLTRGYGTLGGFTTMVANAGGPVMSMYFIASRFPVKRFLGTSAWFFAIVNLTKVPFSVGLGLVTGPSLLLDLVLVPMVLLGALGGRWLAGRIRQDVFERLVIVLTVLGALNLVR
ncbi:sulfite exporter TauE/SafE family protein [Georgenia sp. H159]|uniref:sulfite exporter TauE/SafE family protein n=1 Tax=Georgenia sp. H159 TaxID=3076115 RepID=UPI002D7A14D6|nr:sulfite exporter TauE/SafE family protein [Georgenia sp. H159]